MAENERLGPLPVGSVGKAQNQRHREEQNARNLETWRQAVTNVNRLAAASFSHHVIRVLLARQRIEGAKMNLQERAPERTPSPEEQPSRPADVIPSALKKAAVDAAKAIRRRDWEKSKE